MQWEEWTSVAPGDISIMIMVCDDCNDYNVDNDDYGDHVAW